MAPDTQEVVLGALDAALALHIGKLFDVLLSQPPEEDGLERFWRGLNNAVGMHERLVAELKFDDECTGPGSSGSAS